MPAVGLARAAESVRQPLQPSLSPLSSSSSQLWGLFKELGAVVPEGLALQGPLLGALFQGRLLEGAAAGFSRLWAREGESQSRLTEGSSLHLFDWSVCSSPKGLKSTWMA